MSFTGKATYAAGATLPEIAEDVSDIVSIISPYETPLLDALGDPLRAAGSTYHEWLEDRLLPNKDAIDQSSWSDPASDAAFGVDNPGRFRLGDQVRPDGSAELMLVQSINAGTSEVTVTRGYGGTTPEDLADDQVLHILSNAPSVRFTNRVRRGNWTQIFTAQVRVSGSDLAVRKVAVGDELDYQKQERLRELLRDLENTVLNGTAPQSTPQGSASIRRTMRGIIPSIVTNRFAPGADGFPADADLTEAQLNLALRTIWEHSAARVDTIVVNGYQMRRINGFVTNARAFGPADTNFRDLMSTYESDFGLCRVLLSHRVPADSVLLLDSSRVDVLPLAGRSFHYKPLASSGDYEAGEVIGEYTLELRNEAAHGIISGLDVS